MKRFALLILLAAACGDSGSAAIEHDEPEGEPELLKLTEVEDFSFASSQGTTLTRETLKGRVWVASFIFTRCTSICIPMCAELRALQDEFASEPGLALVSTTVDPEYDTVEVLAEFAKTQGARKDRWYLLTGTEDKIKAFAYQALKVPGHPDEIMAHSDYLVLVDGEGVIRGYYKQAERDRMRQLRTDIKTLLAGQP